MSLAMLCDSCASAFLSVWYARDYISIQQPMEVECLRNIKGRRKRLKRLPFN
jgi:hypothetical protein